MDHHVAVSSVLEAIEASWVLRQLCVGPQGNLTVSFQSLVDLTGPRRISVKAEA